MTPYQRLMECPEVTDEIKEALKSLKEKLNPFELRELIEANLKLIAFHLKQEENTNEAA